MTTEQTYIGSKTRHETRATYANYPRREVEDEDLLVLGGQIRNCSDKLVSAPAYTLLDTAAMNGHRETVDFLIERRSELGSVSLKLLIEFTGRHGHFSVTGRFFQLFTVISRDPISCEDLGDFIFYASEGVDIPTIDIFTQYLLDRADLYEVESAADREYLSDCIFKALSGSIMHGRRVEVARKLLEVKRFIGLNERNKRDGLSPLHLAAKRGLVDIMETLIKNGAVYGSYEDADDSPLEDAAANGFDEAVGYLLDTDGLASIDDLVKGKPAIYWAARHNRRTTVRLLISRNASLEMHKMPGNEDWDKADAVKTTVLDMIREDKARLDPGVGPAAGSTGTSSSNEEAKIRALSGGKTPETVIDKEIVAMLEEHDRNLRRRPT